MHWYRLILFECVKFNNFDRMSSSLNSNRAGCRYRAFDLKILINSSLFNDRIVIFLSFPNFPTALTLSHLKFCLQIGKICQWNQITPKEWQNIFPGSFKVARVLYSWSGSKDLNYVSLYIRQVTLHSISLWAGYLKFLWIHALFFYVFHWL